MHRISLCELARFSMLSNISLECSAMTFGCGRLSMSTHMHCLQEIMPWNCYSNVVNTNLVDWWFARSWECAQWHFVCGQIRQSGNKNRGRYSTVPRNSFILCGQFMYPSGATISFPELDTRTSSVQKSWKQRYILLHIVKSCTPYKKPKGKRERFPTSG